MMRLSLRSAPAAALAGRPCMSALVQPPPRLTPLPCLLSTQLVLRWNSLLLDMCQKTRFPLPWSCRCSQHCSAWDNVRRTARLPKKVCKREHVPWLSLLRLLLRLRYPGLPSAPAADAHLSCEACIMMARGHAGTGFRCLSNHNLQQQARLCCAHMQLQPWEIMNDPSIVRQGHARRSEAAYHLSCQQALLVEGLHPVGEVCHAPAHHSLSQAGEYDIFLRAGSCMAGME